MQRFSNARVRRVKKKNDEHGRRRHRQRPRPTMPHNETWNVDSDPSALPGRNLPINSSIRGIVALNERIPVAFIMDIALLY